MEKLADLKRVQVGDTFTMTFSALGGGSLLNVPRKVKRVQSNALQFEPTSAGRDGSWLYFPPAKEFKPEPDGFSVMEGDKVFLTYRKA